MILAKTALGQQAFRDRSGGLKPRQRSAFILFDGRRSVSDVLAAGTGASPEDIEQMIEGGMLVQQPAVAAGAVPSTATIMRVEAPDGALPDGAQHTSQRYQDAYAVAIRLTGAMGLRGFRLNLAVEGAGSYQDLLALAPRIRAAVDAQGARDLDRALGL